MIWWCLLENLRLLVVVLVCLCLWVGSQQLELLLRCRL